MDSPHKYINTNVCVCINIHRHIHTGPIKILNICPFHRILAILAKGDNSHDDSATSTVFVETRGISQDAVINQQHAGTRRRYRY